MTEAHIDPRNIPHNGDPPEPLTPLRVLKLLIDRSPWDGWGNCIYCKFGPMGLKIENMDAARHPAECAWQMAKDFYAEYNKWVVPAPEGHKPGDPVPEGYRLFGTIGHPEKNYFIKREAT